MDSLFLTRMENYKNHPGRKIIDQSAIIMNKTFNRDTNYKVGSLYATDGELLEECLEYIKADEYVEVTPKSMRMRKIVLDHLERKRANKE